MTLSALKEWDVQTQALTQGRTALLIRKGGIMETHAGFEVEHRSFLLYPTFLHQNPEELRSGLRSLLRDDSQPGTIHLPGQAEVVAVWKIEDEAAALALEDLQSLNAQAISRRFQYRGRPWVHALLLRVRPLTPSLALPETPQMLGCVSWVPLGDPSVQPGDPVLNEAQLMSIQTEIERRLSTAT